MIKIKKGFSTAEMLVTVLIFSLGMLPLIVLFQNSHKQTAQAKNLVIAQSIGRSMISEIKAMGFDVLSEEIKTSKYGLMHSDREVSGYTVPSDENSIEYPEYYKRFKTTVTLKEVERDGGKPANKIQVSLKVDWQEPNRKFALSFGTVVVKYGM